MPSKLLKLLPIFLLFEAINANVIAPDPIYNGCGSSKTCLGFPEDCLPDKDCVTFSSAYKKDGKYIFEMISWKNAAFIAMGLSDDNRMGNDSVVECVKEHGDLKLYSSWTVVKNRRYSASREGVPQDFMRLVDGKIEDNRIYCHVERDAVTTVKDTEFDLNSNSYYLLLASGTSLKEKSVNYHDYAYIASDKKINFNRD